MLGMALGLTLGSKDGVRDGFMLGLLLGSALGINCHSPGFAIPTSPAVIVHIILKNVELGVINSVLRANLLPTKLLSTFIICHTK